MIEIFKHANYDFLGKKWLFIGLSWLLILAGAVSVAWRALDGNDNTHPFNLGVDFSGGTIVNVKFREKPDLGRLRAAIEQQGIEGPKITLQPVGDEIGQAPKNEVLVRLPNLVNVQRREGQSETSAQSTDSADIGKQKIRAALDTLTGSAVTQGKTDLNAVGRDSLKEALLTFDPLGLRAGGATQSAETRYGEIANRIIDYREKDRGGLIGSVDEVKNLSGIEPQLGDALSKNFYTSAAAIRGAGAVSPQIGAELRNRAIYVTFAACIGMLLFIAFRFKSWGFGIGAVIAVFHDVLITLGIFSITQLEIDLTVIAALLTLVGYSMNDTIVIFDRIREMMRTRRREGLEKLSNDAINQTLSRTIITSGLTFLTVVALVLFGGAVLKSFSWCLFIGIIIGTYSSIYIASPFMLWWEGRKGSKVVPAEAPAAASPAATQRLVSTAAAGGGQGRRNARKGKR
ncbi:MAG TPA: protein translocase subunit SecF [Blastocatellia bacterium]|nr:protein translocase subunit SecF [Blastocatellia bacterium]